MIFPHYHQKLMSNVSTNLTYCPIILWRPQQSLRCAGNLVESTLNGCVVQFVDVCEREILSVESSRWRD